MRTTGKGTDHVCGADTPGKKELEGWRTRGGVLSMIMSHVKTLSYLMSGMWRNRELYDTIGVCGQMFDIREGFKDQALGTPSLQYD